MRGSFNHFQIQTHPQHMTLVPVYLCYIPFLVFFIEKVKEGCFNSDLATGLSAEDAGGFRNDTHHRV